MGAIKTIRLLHQLRKNQWLKISELEELQSKKLRAIIEHAYENIGFYHHRKFKDTGVRPVDKSGKVKAAVSRVRIDW